MNMIHRYMRRHRYASRTQRRIVRILALGCCEYCGDWTWNSVADVDHVVPYARGGWTTLPNLAWSCHGCNLSKGARTPREAWPWRRHLRRGMPR